MSRLKAALLREYEHDTETKIQIYNPRNTASVEFHFKGEKSAKVRCLMAQIRARDFLKNVFPSSTGDGFFGL